MSNLFSTLENLVSATVTATNNLVSPFKVPNSPFRDLQPVGLSFSHLDAESVVNDAKEDKEGMVKSILKWLMEVATSLIKSVTVHSHVLKEQQRQVNTEGENLAALQLQVKGLERDLDEARQRGLKGNLIISSPNHANRPSLLLPQKVKDEVTGVVRNESYLEACTRAIMAKTGVRVPAGDVYACHPISRRGVEANTMFVIGFSNRRTHSAWDVLSNGLVTGKNHNGEFFTSANLYISFQLTSRRAKLAKLAREALGSRGGVARCKVDANGRVFVKMNSDAHTWQEIHDEVQFKAICATEKARRNPLSHK